jgi:hypothetical protein
MNCLANEHAREIDACLGKWSGAVKRPADALWELTLRDGCAPPVRARLMEDWLQFDAHLGAVAGLDQIWSALEWNGKLEGAAKLALDPAGRLLRARAEIPLDGECSVAQDLAATLSGIERAAGLVRIDSDREGEEHPDPITAPSQDPAAPPLRQLLADAGWQFVERPGGSFMADLECGGDFRQALVQAGPEQDSRASVELACWESHAPASRDALAVLLLTASGAVRMARPAAEQSGDRIAARFEVRLASHASPALLGRGLAALSVACRLCGREAAILNNERIAERYLAVRGFKTARFSRRTTPWKTPQP